MTDPKRRVTWRFWIDRGGTFTDCVGVDPRTGGLIVAKVLSSDGAPLVGIREILQLRPQEPIPPCEVRMGTTVATNALLERRGVPTALVITRGFEDLLIIGDQTRPDIFDLAARRPAPLVSVAVGVPSRASADGGVVADDVGSREALEEAAREAPSAAVVIMHGPRAPSLERRVAAAARDAGFSHVSVSHEVDNEQGLLARAETTAVDAYLTPLLTEYVAGLREGLPGSALQMMQSSGALTDASSFRGRNAVLSGPAGGVVALGWIAKSAGVDRAIGFDMGGTSTDVCRFAGEPELTYESRVAGVRLRAPMMAIHTVAAGGGSIARFERGRLTVGPMSAGADPGPLAYGRPNAEEPTLTDVNVALGRLPADRFPFALDEDGPRRAMEAIAAEVGRTWEQVAAGFLDVAVANMADAIHRVTVARGYDAREHALVVFGGAGGQHACRVARALGIRRVILHPLAGVLSALGMGIAEVGWHGESDLGGRVVDEHLLESIEEVFQDLEARGREALPAATRAVRRVDLRYEGTQTDFTLEAGPGLAAAFAARHLAEVGYERPGHPIVAKVARVELAEEAPPPSIALPVGGAGDTPVKRRSRAFFGDTFVDDVPLHDREQVGVGARVDGPAIILEATGAIVVEPGWVLEVAADGRVDLVDQGSPDVELADETRDPVRLEILSNAFISIAEQMGEVLRRAAMSTNIRERLDFSCALFDREGALVANAPHIPVHLGAMGETVRAVLAVHPEPARGDVFASNDPAAGGSHLPDITVVSPVHDDSGTLRFFVASRGHHADVGGITPGSMPPFSRTLEEEGVVLRAIRIVHAGRLDRDGLLATLTDSPHPARRPLENLADLEAQIAANRKGAALLGALAARHGHDVVAAYMGHVQDDASERVADAIGALADAEYEFEDSLDDGAAIRVRCRVEGRAMSVDFAGTAGELRDANLNAPRAVTIAALLYVLRSIVGSKIPLCSGCLEPVSLDIPPGSVLDPSPERAVAGGNVETSQRVVDVLLGALGQAAASQGTMNNLTFGDETFGYYETIAGGAGAGPGWEGTSGVHTHMTNSRITDPEVLEDRYPVRLTRFALRRGSGGAGAHRGGDGVIREIEALAPLRFSILSERRSRAPFGLAGGSPGAKGRNTHVRADGERELEARVVLDVAPGERIRIETPGGGGWGEPSS